MAGRVGMAGGCGDTVDRNQQEAQVTDRPYVLLSAAMSVDGYIDDSAPRRLVLSGDADADRVDGVRAECDAILVGAGTIRRDNPRLLLRSPRRRDERLAGGRPPGPVKVTLSRSGDLDPAARFFADGDVPRLVYTPGPASAAEARRRLGSAAAVIELAGTGASAIGSADGPVSLIAMLADLTGRGIARLMVEGGSQVQAGFLAAGLVDELQLAIAPFFVADPAAPRLAGGRWLPAASYAPMQLAEVRRAGNMAVLRYLLPGRGDRP